MHTLTLALLTCALTPDTLLQPLTSLTLHVYAMRACFTNHHPPRGPLNLDQGTGIIMLPFLRAFLLATTAVLAAMAARRSQLFWCNARGVRLGTMFAPPGFKLEDMPDMNGKVAVVTGANSGLGREVALQLVVANATVVLACRDADKCSSTSDELHRVASDALAPATAIVPIPASLDLDDLSSVSSFERDLGGLLGISHETRIDLLVLNAGCAAQYPTKLTRDGIERTFQSNYLGHFALTMALMPWLERAAHERGVRSRVVHLTSGAHRGAPPSGVPLSLSDVNDARIGGYARYGISKLANLIFARELARRHGQTVLSHAVHPGVVATDMLRVGNFRAMLGSTVGGLVWRLAQARNALFAYTPREAAASVLYAAAAPELDAEDNGLLIVPIATRWEPNHPTAMDAAAGDALWKFSQQLVAQATPTS